MDPYLEYPAFWPDFHNSLASAMRDALAPLVAPRYYIALERHTYLLSEDDLAFIGIPDLSVVARNRPESSGHTRASHAALLEVDVPVKMERRENILQVHEVTTRALVSVLEILSPVNKLHAEGRQEFLKKRARILQSRTHLVEVDLLRAGEPMPVIGEEVQSDYRVLISRGDTRPRSQLYAFTLRDPLPSFVLPLLPGDQEPIVELGSILHGLYERARFDLRIDYARPSVPPISIEDAEWARALLKA